MRKVIWEVRLLTPPPVWKYCKKCGKRTAYASSGRFRVNAQKKSLDIWLIYKCLVCNTTWNVTVLSRVNPKSMNPELLDRFHANDEELAKQYAANIRLLHQNGGEAEPGNYEIDGEDLSCQESADLHIVNRSGVPVKVVPILRRKFGVSRKELNDMIAGGLLTSMTGEDLNKCKLEGEICLHIRRQAET